MNSPSHENIDQWLFERIEGNLSFEQEQELSLFLLLNPSYDIDIEAWEKSKVNFPAVDVEFVNSMNFGVNEAEEEKQKKRPVGMWLFSSAIAFICIGSFISILILGKPFSQKETPRISHKKQTINTPKNNAYHNARNIRSNKKLALSYSVNSMGTNKINLVKNTSTNFNLARYTNFSNSIPTPLITHAATSDNHNSFEDTRPIELHLAKPILKQEIEGRDLLNTKENEEITSSQHPLKIKFPSLNINKSSILGKYLKQEVVSATQKDRVYFMQEQSHLDISDAFAGNRSQTRFQTTSFGRWIGDENQKLTQQLSIDGYSRNLKSGFGTVANYTDFGNGAIKEWNVRLIYSPKIAMGRYLSIEPSISYVFGQKSINATKTTSLSSFEYLTNYEQQFNYDLSKPIGQHLLYRDLNLGLNLNLGPIYLGISTQNLLKHQDNIHTNKFDTIARANMSSTFFMGTDFSAKKGEIMFSPLLSHSIGLTKNLTQIGATFQVKGFVIGGNYGSNTSLGALVGYQAENFSLIAQSLKTKPLTGIQPQFVHQLTLRINTNISRKTRRYLYL